jgi:ubiquinone/menaquinone biosynthesis C-methylase UbiE
MKNRFTEGDTERFYDGEDAVYRTFWDEEGSLHWGIFDSSTGDDFLKACANLSTVMVRMAAIGKNAKVLDLGCGNGTTSLWLCKNCGCRAVGVDLSGVRISNARQGLEQQRPELKGRLQFKKASATDLPFDDGSFTHVWSQATIYHVHDKQQALKEAYRVLAEGGVFVFDDLTKPKPDIGDDAEKYVYDRLLFDTDLSFESYQDALRSTGFRILDAQDISDHLKKSYDCLAGITRKKGDPDGKYGALCQAYEQMVRAIENRELGWGLYLCQK